jgi:hypothetical protein
MVQVLDARPQRLRVSTAINVASAVDWLALSFDLEPGARTLCQRGARLSPFLLFDEIDLGLDAEPLVLSR